MRLLIFHGYLLGGTGSNVYNARLAEALVALGHEVHLLSQERRPEQHSFIDAYGHWDRGELELRETDHGRARREAVAASGANAARCIVYRPNIGGLLPLYVADRYEGIEARTFAECTDAEVAAYVDANVAAVREVRARVRPELALANHLVMGPLILARGLEGEVPYAVKIHGSALEYTVKPQPERFLEPAREGLAGAGGVLVGSHHTAASLWQALADPALAKRTRLGPPGVDVERFAPRPRDRALAGLSALEAQLREQPAPVGVGESAFARDPRTAAAELARLDPEQDALVAFVGKLIVSKGVDLLIAAWPLVLEAVPHARLVIVGFGAYRDGLQRLLAALQEGDVEGARAVALQGRALEGEGGSHPLRHLLAFLESLQGAERERYLAAARALGERIVLVGRLEHEELAELLPACEALVVPSTFPESFGMVAAEAAACGVLPISAAHSGLQEVSGALAGAVPADVGAWLGFHVDDQAVRALSARLVSWLTAPCELRSSTRQGLVAAVRQRWSWQSVAGGVIAAARGELERLQPA